MPESSVVQFRGELFSRKGKYVRLEDGGWYDVSGEAAADAELPALGVPYEGRHPTGNAPVR